MRPGSSTTTPFAWTDDSWRGVALPGSVLYELHVGTFSTEGTFEGAIDHLSHLVDLGVDAIEVLPVGEFPGRWGWGYDGVDLYAPHHAYGGPDGLKRLVDACQHYGRDEQQFRELAYLDPFLDIEFVPAPRPRPRAGHGCRLQPLRARRELPLRRFPRRDLFTYGAAKRQSLCYDQRTWSGYRYENYSSTPRRCCAVSGPGKRSA